MADLVEFSRPGFDPKAWINATCSNRSSEEPLERFLAELEMKLQLTAEDVEASLESNSNKILQRIPNAVQEIRRVKGDVLVLQSDTQRILEQLDASHRKASASVAPLASLDLVKARMEDACNTLREATELSSLFGSIEEVFATGNLPRVAEVLSTMRRSLAAVGDVPEFNDGWKQLESLENRLQAMVEGPLSGAMAHKKGDMVRQLVEILVAINRYSVVEKHYVAARMAPLLKFWDSFEAEKIKPDSERCDFVQWLPRFYDEVLLGVEGEARWCQAVLPDLHPRLLVSMLEALFARARKNYDRRLKDSVEPQETLLPTSLANVMSAQGSCILFCRSLLETHPDLKKHGQAVTLVTSCLEPFDKYLARYGDLEAALLAHEIMVLNLEASAKEEELDSIVNYMTNSVPHMIQTVEHAVERCLKFTGGAEIGALLKVADEALAQFCGQLLAILTAIRGRCIPKTESNAPKQTETVNSDEGWGGGLDDDHRKDNGSAEEAGAVIQLLSVSGSLVGQLGVLEAQMHTAVAEAAALVERQGSEVPGSDPTALAVMARLSRDPKLLSSLSALSEQVQDQRYNALPSSTQRASSVQQTINALVYDSLIFRVAAELKPVPGLQSWAQDADNNAFNLPSFSAYPSGYASSIGEYLMTLPQQLEAWMPGEASEEVSNTDAEWLDKVATGAADLYTQSLLSIPKLSPKGAQQISADLEYFCNVLSALSVAIPPALATIQVAVGLPDDGFSTAATDSLEQPFIDRKTFDQIATMRGLAV